MLSEIGGFLVETFGPTFFMQYFFSKGLDKIGNKVKNNSIKKDLVALFEGIYNCMCDENGWENNIDAVYASLQKNSINIEKLYDMNYVDSFFREILGQEFHEYYDINLAEQWKQCLREIILQPKFSKIYKLFEFDKVEKLDNIVNNLLISEEAWEKREVDQREKNAKVIKTNNEIEKNNDLELAIQIMEEEDYKDAIEKFRKVCVGNSNKQVKYICFYYEAYCYGKLAVDSEGFNKALNLFFKAEKYMNPSRDDAVLLYRNIALLYTYIGIEKEKVTNYKKANIYFEKVLAYTKEEDEYYIIEVILHIARNHMDMCDEVSMSEVQKHLHLAMERMLPIYLLDENGLSEEQCFLLLHNMGKVFFHFAEKNNNVYLLELARNLYSEVLKIDIVKQDKERFAMVNNNLAMAYHFDFLSEIENLNKALVYYQIAFDSYKKIDNCVRQLLNLQLNMAEAYARLYLLLNEENNFVKAKDLLYDALKKVDSMPYNSLYLRIHLSLMKLYYKQVMMAEVETEREEWLVEADKIGIQIEGIITSADYEKYKYTYLILKYKLNLYRIDDTTDIFDIIKIRNELQKIAEKVKNGNANLYKITLETLNEYVEAIEWRKEK